MAGSSLERPKPFLTLETPPVWARTCGCTFSFLLFNIKNHVLEMKPVVALRPSVQGFAVARLGIRMVPPKACGARRCGPEAPSFSNIVLYYTIPYYSMLYYTILTYEYRLSGDLIYASSLGQSVLDKRGLAFGRSV